MSMTWTTLTGDKTVDESIKNWVNHAEVPAATVLDEAQALIFQRLRVVSMRTLKTGTLAEDAVDLDLSSDRVVQPISFRFIGAVTQKVELLEHSLFEDLLAFDESGVLVEGVPQTYYLTRETAHFDAKASQALPYRFWYYKEAPRLASGSQETNLLTDKYPHILRAACLAQAYSYRKDFQRRETYLQEMATYIEIAMEDSDTAAAGARYANEY